MIALFLFSCTNSDKQICFGNACGDTAITDTSDSTPPTEEPSSCFDNEVTGTLNGIDIAVNHFIWDKSEEDGIIYVVGFSNFTQVDICNALADSTPFDFPQLHLTTYPIWAPSPTSSMLESWVPPRVMTSMPL